MWLSLHGKTAGLIYGEPIIAVWVIPNIAGVNGTGQASPWEGEGGHKQTTNTYTICRYADCM